MKAAVLHQLGQAPKYEEFPEPVANNSDEVLLHVKAASIKNLDKGRASGAHYGSHTNLPEVVGVDGIGLLENGQKVYAMGITGMMAEKALIHKDKFVIVPAGLDDATAAALPNTVIGAALALLYRAQMQQGKTVLINGATGVTGKVAVQVAKYYGAHKVIATGRNPEALNRVRELGADEIISLKQDDEQIISQVKEIHSKTPIDIVIDYTWGHPAELILQALKGGGIHGITHPVRFVTVGGMAGDSIRLSSGILRSSAIEILGSGLGSLPLEALLNFNKQVLPEMMALAVQGKLKVDIDTVPLADIEKAWQVNEATGKRLVVMI